MAKEPAPELDAIAPLDDAPKPPKSYRMYILLGMVLLILIQTTMMFFLLPSPQTIATQVGGLNDPTIEQFNPEAAMEGEQVATLAKVVTNPLNEDSPVFKIQQTNPEVPGGQLTFTASVSLVIDKKDEKAFDKLFADKALIVRQEIEIILRNSKPAERRESTVGTIRRKLLVKVNEVLDPNKKYVRDVLCTDVTEGEM